MYIEDSVLLIIDPTDIINDTFTIPEGVTEIPSFAFDAQYESIRHIIVPKTVTKIDVDAFNVCHNLVSIIFKNINYEVRRILFYNCPKLSLVQIGAYKYNLLWLEGKHYHITSQASQDFAGGDGTLKGDAIYTLKQFKPEEHEKARYGDIQFYLAKPRNTHKTYGVGNTPGEAIRLCIMGGIDSSNISERYCDLSLDSKITAHDYKLICKQISHVPHAIEEWLARIDRANNYFCFYEAAGETPTVRDLLVRMHRVCAEELLTTEKEQLPDDIVREDLNNLINILAKMYETRAIKKPHNSVIDL